MYIYVYTVALRCISHYAALVPQPDKRLTETLMTRSGDRLEEVMERVTLATSCNEETTSISPFFVFFSCLNRGSVPQ